MGNHFGYFFCLLISGLLLFAPVFAMANAPDRFLTPFDIPVAIVLLFLFLRKPVRDYFKQQRSQWQSKQASKLQQYDQLQPLFAKSAKVFDGAADRMFWTDGDKKYMFLNGNGMAKAHVLESMEQAQQIRAKWLRYLSFHKKMMLLVAGMLVVGFAMFSWVGFISGEELNEYILLPVGISLLLAAITPLMQANYLNKLRKQLPETNLAIKPMVLFELYGARNKQNKESTQKFALISISVFMAVMVIFGLTVSPKIMEKRRADAALQASTEVVVE